MKKDKKQSNMNMNTSSKEQSCKDCRDCKDCFDSESNNITDCK